MTLYENLKHVKSEEDVKDIYIKALGLKGYTKGLIDIQTKEIWFEAKDTGKTSSYVRITAKKTTHYRSKRPCIAGRAVALNRPKRTMEYFLRGSLIDSKADIYQ